MALECVLPDELLWTNIAPVRLLLIVDQGVSLQVFRAAKCLGADRAYIRVGRRGWRGRVGHRENKRIPELGADGLKHSSMDGFR